LTGEQFDKDRLMKMMVALGNCSFLKQLCLQFKITDFNSIYSHNFFESLKKCEHLMELSINLGNIEILENKSLAEISQSISHFLSLYVLTIEICSQKNTVTTRGLTEFFKKLGKLRFLRELSVSFPNSFKDERWDIKYIECTLNPLREFANLRKAHFNLPLVVLRKEFSQRLLNIFQKIKQIDELRLVITFAIKYFSRPEEDYFKDKLREINQNGKNYSVG